MFWGDFNNSKHLFLIFSMIFISFPSFVAWLIFFVADKILIRSRPDKTTTHTILRFLWIIALAGIIGGIAVGLLLEFYSSKSV